MLVKLQVFLLLIGFTIPSCIDLTESKDVLMDKYPLPNIDSLIQNQSNLLDGRKVLKHVALDEQEEELTIDADSSFWASELSVFTGLEINRPSLVGAYEKTQEDSSLTFKRKKDEKKGAMEVKIISSSNENILEISGIVREHNALYISEQKLMMSFDENTQLLKQYSFSGFQKLIARDTAFFEIEGVVK